MAAATSTNRNSSIRSSSPSPPSPLLHLVLLAVSALLVAVGSFYLPPSFSLLAALHTPASAAVNASSEVSFNYGSYTSEYVHLKSDVLIDWYDADPMCKAYGSTWALGGVYSSGATSAVLPIITAATYMGGIVPQIPSSMSKHQFVWVSGRKQGTYVSTYTSPSTCSTGGYCNYRTGEPNNGSQCVAGGTLQISLQIYTAGDWDDTAPDDCGTPAHTSALCERSLCTVAADCTAANSAGGVSGYYPQCTCTCKAGYEGPSCQVDSRSYFEDGREFAAMCVMDALNASVANALCNARGVEWNLASITSASIAANTKVLTNSTVWTGGAWDVAISKHKWQYGRYANQAFSSGLYPGTVQCEVGMYCMWSTNQPDRTDCGDGSELETDIILKSDGLMNDLWSNGCGMVLSRESRCFICERSLCVMSDCPPRTSHVSGYFPSCVCQTETMTPTSTFDISNTTSIAETDTVSLFDTASASISQSISRSPTPSTSRSAPTATPSLPTSASLSPTTSNSIPPTDSSTLTATASISASDSTSASGTSTTTLSSSLSSSTTDSLSITTSASTTGSVSKGTPSNTPSGTSSASVSTSGSITLSTVPTDTSSYSTTTSLPKTSTVSIPITATPSKLTRSLTATTSSTESTSTTTSISISSTLSDSTTHSFSGTTTQSLSSTHSDSTTHSTSETHSLSPSTTSTESGTSSISIPTTDTASYSTTTSLPKTSTVSIPTTATPSQGTSSTTLTASSTESTSTTTSPSLSFTFSDSTSQSFSKTESPSASLSSSYSTTQSASESITQSISTTYSESATRSMSLSISQSPTDSLPTTASLTLPHTASISPTASPSTTTSIDQSTTVSVPMTVSPTPSLTIDPTATSTIQLFDDLLSNAQILNYVGASSLGAMIALGGTPFEVQAMVVVMSSECATNGDRSSAELGHYFVAPLWSVGHEAAVIGNVAIAVVFFALHALLATIATSYYKTHGSLGATGDALAYVWFPGCSLCVCGILYIGVAFHWVGLLSGGVPDSGLAMWIVGAAVGLPYLVAVPCAHGYAVWAGTDGFFSPNDLSGCGRLEAVFLRTSGRWAPEWYRGRFMLSVSGFVSRRMQIWGGNPLLLSVVCFAVPLGAVSGRLGCMVACAGMGVVCAAFGIAAWALRPQTNAVQNVLTGTCMVLLGLMCAVQAAWVWSPTELLLTAKTVVFVTLVTVAVLRALQWIVSLVYEACVGPPPEKPLHLGELPSVDAYPIPRSPSARSEYTISDTESTKGPSVPQSLQFDEDEGIILLDGSSLSQESFMSYVSRPASPSRMGGIATGTGDWSEGDGAAVRVASTASRGFAFIGSNATDSPRSPRVNALDHMAATVTPGLQALDFDSSRSPAPRMNAMPDLVTPTLSPRSPRLNTRDPIVLSPRQYAHSINTMPSADDLMSPQERE